MSDWTIVTKLFMMGQEMAVLQKLRQGQLKLGAVAQRGAKAYPTNIKTSCTALLWGGFQSVVYILLPIIARNIQ